MMENLWQKMQTQLNTASFFLTETFASCPQGAISLALIQSLAAPALPPSTSGQSLESEVGDDIGAVFDRQKKEWTEKQPGSRDLISGITAVPHRSLNSSEGSTSLYWRRAVLPM